MSQIKADKKSIRRMPAAIPAGKSFRFRYLYKKKGRPSRRMIRTLVLLFLAGCLIWQKSEMLISAWQPFSLYTTFLRHKPRKVHKFKNRPQDGPVICTCTLPFRYCSRFCRRELPP